MSPWCCMPFLQYIKQVKESVNHQQEEISVATEHTAMVCSFSSHTVVLPPPPSFSPLLTSPSPTLTVSSEAPGSNTAVWVLLFGLYV